MSAGHPRINCHTHTFTGDHVPPYIGKKMLPLGLGYLFTIPLIVHFFRWYNRVPDRWRFSSLYKQWTTVRFRIRFFLSRIPYIVYPVITLLTVDALLILFADYLRAHYSDKAWIKYVNGLEQWLVNWHLLPAATMLWLRWLLVLFVFFLSKSARNLILFIAKSLFRFLKILPGPETKAYIMRYLSIGRFAFHQEQATIFDMLQKQYPDNMRFVVLPMDMDYMEAGKPIRSYTEQLKELRELKQKRPEACLPFVFADPRRIRDDAAYHNTVLSCIVDDGFRGIKTYPALGYYPFDKDLLPLLLWACEHEIPVLNHCIRGTIYYRGDKKAAWNEHDLFVQSTGRKGETEPLKLYELKNSAFSVQFTHPLNYLCLLSEPHLRRLLERYNDPTLFALFGYRDSKTPLDKNLHRLKICFGHFGGEDEWMNYLESDRYRNNNLFSFDIDKGINFTDGAIENIWKYASWFSIIYSLMLQYPNVYADISYILHDERIFPLLKTLLHPDSHISDRILYGSDFYVVRNHKTDKEMWAETAGHLSEAQLELLTQSNPRQFLYNTIHSYVA